MDQTGSVFGGPETSHVINIKIIGGFHGVNGISVSGMFFDPTVAPHTIHVENDGVVTTTNNGTLRATITNNYFNFSRIPSQTYDHSAIYLEGSQQVVTGNTFLSTLNQAAGTAVEIHGGRSSVSNNTANYYATLANVVPTVTGIAAELSPNNVVVSNNSITCAQNGILLTGLGTTRTLRNISITGNTIQVCNGLRFSQANPRSFAGVAWATSAGNPTLGDLDGLDVSNNVVTMDGDTSNNYAGNGATNAAILLYTGGNISNVLVAGNIVTNSPVSGIRVGSSAASGVPVQRVRVTDNLIVDAGNNSPLRTTGDAQYLHAIGLYGTAKEVDVMRNLIYDTGTPSQNPTASNGWYSLYLNSTQGLSANIRTSQNTIRTAWSGTPSTPALKAFQVPNAGIVDATNANDVSISTVLANSATSTAVPSVDFMSFTRYITTIRSDSGSLMPLLVNVPLPGGDPTAAQWSVGQRVTFRFRCDNSGTGGCFVAFDPAFSGACETQTGQACPPGPTSILIPTPTGTMGRAITFGVESVATSGRRFFELYRTPTPGVPD